MDIWELPIDLSNYLTFEQCKALVDELDRLDAITRNAVSRNSRVSNGHGVYTDAGIFTWKEIVVNAGGATKDVWKMAKDEDGEGIIEYVIMLKYIIGKESDALLREIVDVTYDDSAYVSRSEFSKYASQMIRERNVKTKIETAMSGVPVEDLF